MSLKKYFTSESVSMGHPDKVADQISDSVLDAIIAQDPNAHVACETMVTTGLVVLAGEITCDCYVDIPKIARQAIKEIGYTDASMGFDYETCAVVTSIDAQSPDIDRGVSKKDQGAGDQGIMFGYACDETKELMPLPIMLAHQLMEQHAKIRQKGVLKYLRPDAKSQVTIEYDENDNPLRVHTVLISTQHGPEVSQKKIKADLIKHVINPIIPKNMMDKKTIIHVNPTGRFVEGGPKADCGLTGRKIIVDTYGGVGRHGGGAFSGKDPSKVDRSATYAARYIAKNIVAAKLAKRCEVQLSYAIGISKPLSIYVDTYGTGVISDRDIESAIPKVFPVKPADIIKELKLRRPIYRDTARHGHFGRTGAGFTWEKADRVNALLKALKLDKKKKK